MDRLIPVLGLGVVVLAASALSSSRSRAGGLAGFMTACAAATLP